MGQTLALADAVLKDDYQGPLRKQINDRVKFIAQFDKNTTDFVGRRAIVPCHVGRNTGRGWRLEGEVMAPAGNQKTVDAIINMRYGQARVRLTKQVISHMASDRGAFVRAVKMETEGVVTDMVRDRAVYGWGNGTGALAQCGTTSGSVTVQLDTDTPESILVHIREGMAVDIGTAADPDSVASQRLVTGVDLTNKTLTIEGATVTTSSTHFITQYGSGGVVGTDQRVPTGWGLICGTSTFQSIDPSTYPVWQSVIDSNSGTARPFSENLLEKTSHRAENQSGMVADVIYAEDQVYRTVANHLKAYQRIVNQVTLKGGHKGISFSFGGDEDVTLMRDRDAPVGTLNGVATKSISRYVLDDWQWETEDGHVLRLSSDSTHSFEGIYFGHEELGCHQRNANWQIADLELS